MNPRYGGQIIALEKKPRGKCRRWKIRVCIGKNPYTGKYATRNKNIYGTYTEAQNALADFREIVARETFTRHTKIPTFEQCAKEYVAHKLAMGEITDQSARVYRVGLQKYINILGAIKMNAITAEMLTEANKQLLAGNGKNSKAPKPSTIIHSSKTVLALCKFAKKRGYISTNPAENMELPKRQPTEHRILDEKEIQVLLSKLRNDNQRHIAVKIALLAGLRIGEVCALSWGNVNLLDSYLMVTATMVKNCKIQTHPKTNTSKSIQPIPAMLQNALLEWKEKQCTIMAAQGVRQTQSTLVLADEFGHAATISVVSHWWGNNRESLGCRGIKFHELRHSYITMLAKLDTHPAIMQKLARHSTATMTMDVYTHINKAQEYEAINRLDDVLQV